MENKNNPEEIDIQKYWLVLKRRWQVISGVFVACVGLAGLALVTEKPTYEASGKLLFQLDRTSSLTGIGEKIGHLESIRREANPLDTQALLLQSEPMLEEVIKTLNLKDKKGAPLSPEAITIKTEGVTGADAMKVSYASEDPQLAVAVVNQVMKSYIANNVSTNRDEARSAGGFIEKQLPQAKKELDDAGEDVRLFKAKNKIIDLEEETIGTVKTLTTLDEEINEARGDLADLTAREKQISSQLNLPEEQAVNIASLSQIGGVQDLLAELQKVQTQLATQRATYKETHPTISNLKEKEAYLKTLLQQQTAESLGSQAKIAPGKLQLGELKENLTSEYVRIRSERLGLEKKVASLSNLKDVYRQRANTLPHLDKKQKELDQRLLIAQKTYQDLLTKQQEIRIAENQTVGNARVLEYAKVYSNPAAMKKKLMISAGGAFVGLLLGVAAAFFADLIDRRVKTAKEAETLFGYTLLGLIPFFETNRATIETSLEKVSPRVIVTTSPRSVIHEAYQMLQANLKFISLDKKVRIIVVTSSVPGEGKSEVSANLAASMAQAGRRVLLVDADMRQPAQHHLWGLINSAGLTNVVVGQDEFEKVVQKVTPELSVLTAGVIPPNPLALIDSERMTTLIDILAQKYDYIVFDTPPLVGTADAAVLGKIADGVLVVARPGVVDSSSVAAARSLLARSEANILGIVANGVNVKHEPDSYFYYNSRSESVEKVDTLSSSSSFSRS